MKQLHDFRTWLAVAGVINIMLVLFNAQGRAWLIPLLFMGIAFAVHQRYGNDVQYKRSLPTNDSK